MFKPHDLGPAGLVQTEEGMTASVFVSVGMMPSTDFLEQNTTLHSWSVCFRVHNEDQAKSFLDWNCSYSSQLVLLNMVSKQQRYKHISTEMAQNVLL